MEIQGHYENGVVVPHDGINRPDGTEVTIVVQPISQQKSRTLMSAEERQRYLEALARIDAVPNENPEDDFSGADHDQVLYGKRT